MMNRPFARVPQGGVPNGPPITPENRVEEYLDAIAKALVEIRDDLSQRVQMGYVVPFTQVVTGTVPVSIEFSPALFAISFTNDGLATVQYKVPYETQAAWVDLLPTEVASFSFVKGLVNSVGFRVNVVGTATVRGLGTY